MSPACSRMTSRSPRARVPARSPPWNQPVCHRPPSRLSTEYRLPRGQPQPRRRTARKVQEVLQRRDDKHPAGHQREAEHDEQQAERTSHAREWYRDVSIRCPSSRSSMSDRGSASSDTIDCESSMNTWSSVPTNADRRGGDQSRVTVEVDGHGDEREPQRDEGAVLDEPPQLVRAGQVEQHPVDPAPCRHPRGRIRTPVGADAGGHPGSSAAISPAGVPCAQRTPIPPQRMDRPTPTRHSASRAALSSGPWPGGAGHRGRDGRRRAVGRSPVRDGSGSAGRSAESCSGERGSERGSGERRVSKTAPPPDARIGRLAAGTGVAVACYRCGVGEHSSSEQWELRWLRSAPTPADQRHGA